MTVVRAALTETANVFRHMPSRVEDLPALAGRLDAIRAANLEHHVELIRAAHEQGAAIVGLGELFGAPYFALHRDAFWRQLAENAADGPTLTTLAPLARELGLVIVAPIYERDGARRFNTALVLDADGSLLGRFRKGHIPRGGNEQGAFDERFYYQASDGPDNPRSISSNPYLPVFETAVGRVGVSICYDRHFEGMVSGLAAGGAQMVFSPAVTFGAQSERMWELEFAVDAMRHRVYLGGSNRRGAEAPWNQAFFGNSHFVGPDGRCPDLSTHPELVLADLDLDALEQADGAGWNLAADDRPELRRER